MTALLLACPACASSEPGVGSLPLLLMLALPFVLAGIGAFVFTREGRS